MNQNWVQEYLAGEDKFFIIIKFTFYLPEVI